MASSLTRYPSKMQEQLLYSHVHRLQTSNGDDNDHLQNFLQTFKRKHIRAICYKTDPLAKVCIQVHFPFFHRKCNILEPSFYSFDHIEKTDQNLFY